MAVNSDQTVKLALYTKFQNKLIHKNKNQTRHIETFVASIWQTIL